MLNLQLGGFGSYLVWPLSFDLSGLGGPTRSQLSGSLRHTSPLTNVKVTIREGKYLSKVDNFNMFP